MLFRSRHPPVRAVTREYYRGSPCVWEWGRSGTRRARRGGESGAIRRSFQKKWHLPAVIATDDDGTSKIGANSRKANLLLRAYRFRGLYYQPANFHASRRTNPPYFRCARPPVAAVGVLTPAAAASLGGDQRAWRNPFDGYPLGRPEKRVCAARFAGRSFYGAWRETRGRRTIRLHEEPTQPAHSTPVWRARTAG